MRELGKKRQFFDVTKGGVQKKTKLREHLKEFEKEENERGELCRPLGFLRACLCVCV